MGIDQAEGDERRATRNRRLVIFIVVAALIGAAETWYLASGSGGEVKGAAQIVPTGDTGPATTAPDNGPLLPGVQPVLPGLGDSGTDYSGDPLPVVIRRTTAAGIALSLRDSAGQVPGMRGGVFMPPQPAMAGNDGVVVQVMADTGQVIMVTNNQGEAVEVPKWCWSTGSYRLSGVFKDAASVASPSFYADTAPLVRATLHIGGQADGNPFRMLVVHPLAGTTSVTVRFADGATDTSPVVKGVAVLATPGPPSGEFNLFLDRDGVRSVVGWAQVMRDGDALWTRSCSPDQALPQPGPDQPADPDAARNAIRDQFAVLFQSRQPLAERITVLDDDTGVALAVSQLKGTTGEEMFDGASYVLNDVVFAAPDHAWFAYYVSFPGNVFGSRFGEAVLIKGKWRISRATMCQDISWVGSACEPFVDTVYPQ